MRRIIFSGFLMLAAVTLHAQSKGPAYKFANQIISTLGAKITDVDTTENKLSYVFYATVDSNFGDVKTGIKEAEASCIVSPKILRDWYTEFKGKEYYSISYFINGGKMKIMFIPLDKTRGSMIFLTTDKSTE